MCSAKQVPFTLVARPAGVPPGPPGDRPAAAAQQPPTVSHGRPVRAVRRLSTSKEVHLRCRGRRSRLGPAAAGCGPAVRAGASRRRPGVPPPVGAVCGSGFVTGRPLGGLSHRPPDTSRRHDPARSSAPLPRQQRCQTATAANAVDAIVAVRARGARDGAFGYGRERKQFGRAGRAFVFLPPRRVQLRNRVPAVAYSASRGTGVNAGSPVAACIASSTLTTCAGPASSSI